MAKLDMARHRSVAIRPGFGNHLGNVELGDFRYSFSGWLGGNLKQLRKLCAECYGFVYKLASVAAGPCDLRARDWGEAL